SPLIISACLVHAVYKVRRANDGDLLHSSLLISSALVVGSRLPASDMGNMALANLGATKAAYHGPESGAPISLGALRFLPTFSDLLTNRRLLQGVQYECPTNGRALFAIQTEGNETAFDHLNGLHRQTD